MSRVRLTLGERLEAPLDGSPLAPGRICGRPREEIAGVRLRHGNREEPLGELFDVELSGETDDADRRLELTGDLGACDRLGEAMEGGTLVVDGDAGDHLGARMSGGSVAVRGSAGSWCGAEMTGGVIRIEGSVGRRAGAAYPGSRHGMNRGVILVEGDAGPRLGETMRRGLIAVRGRAARHAGAHLVAGSLFLLGGSEGPVGAAMRRGTILATGEPELLPGFRYACSSPSTGGGSGSATIFRWRSGWRPAPTGATAATSPSSDGAKCSCWTNERREDLHVTWTLRHV